MRLRDDAARVYLVMQSIYGFCFTLIVTVNLIYQAATVGLTAFQLVLVGSVLELVCVLCEVPTGALADLVGRRPAIVAGIALIGAGFTLEGLVPELGAILVGNVLFGVGATLTSGAEQAWLTDEVGETAAAGLFLAGARLENGATLAAIPVAVLIAQRTITTPIVLGGLGLVALAVLLAAVMPETRRPVGEGRGLAAGMRAQVAESLAVVADDRPGAAADDRGRRGGRVQRGRGPALDRPLPARRRDSGCRRVRAGRLAGRAVCDPGGALDRRPRPAVGADRAARGSRRTVCAGLGLRGDVG